jgi:hypothetical protein
LLRFFVTVTAALLLPILALNVLSLLIGGTLPDSEQFLYSMKYERLWQRIFRQLPQSVTGFFTTSYGTQADPWSTVRLVSVDRKLTISRHLPMIVDSAIWLSGGSDAVISAEHEDQRRTYLLRWNTSDQALVELPPISLRAVSPDGKWVVVRDVQQKTQIIAMDELITFAENPSQQSGQVIPLPHENLYWTPDSSKFFELPVDDGSVDAQDGKETFRFLWLDENAHEFTDAQQFAFDDTHPYGISPDGSYMVYLWHAERTLPSPEPLDYVDHYETHLLDLTTGQVQVIAERPAWLQLWSSNSRYLMMFPFESDDTTLPDPNIADWHVFYHVESHQLFSKSMEELMQTNGLNEPSDPVNHPDKKIYVYDVTTGKMQLIATKEQFGEGYTVNWIPDSEIIYLIPRTDYYVAYGRPGTELQRLRYKGEDLLTSNYLMSPQTIAYYASGRGAIAAPYFYVNFEKDVVSPIDFGEDLDPGSSLGALNDESMLMTATDRRSLVPGFGATPPTSMFSSLFQVSASDMKLIVDIPSPNNTRYRYLSLENESFSIEVYQMQPTNYPFNNHLQLWWFENVDQTDHPQMMEITSPQLTLIYWRPMQDRSDMRSKVE